MMIHGTKDVVVPEILRSILPINLETSTQNQLLKTQYKRYRFDFYKPGGQTQQPEKVILKPEKHKKR